jgi:hypothetical protein
VGQSEIAGVDDYTNQLAKLMVDILTGEVEDRERTPEERGVDPAASAMGEKGRPHACGEHDAGAT